LLAEHWKFVSARDIGAGGATISLPNYDSESWHPVAHMPATVLEALAEGGLYRNLYEGMNLLKNVARDLYLQDWWCRTTFVAPGGRGTYFGKTRNEDVRPGSDTPMSYVFKVGDLPEQLIGTRVRSS
jgi:hypothetical protein